MAQELAASCGSKLPMVEPGKKPTRGSAAIAAGRLERLREIRRPPDSTARCGKSRAQLRRVLLQEVAGNVDRHIGLDGRRRAEQDARLAARAAAELDQRAVRREQRGDRRRMVAQQRELAARRIIFRQIGDALEQRGAGRVVEIFRRKALRLRAQARQ